MPSLPDGIVIFILALLLFGPKKLPVLARELGKWIGEFRRASNEFKMQMEDELRLSEQADKQKEIAAMEAAAPAKPSLESSPAADTSEEVPAETLPIATSGELKIMPPDTGLPTPRTVSHPAENSGDQVTSSDLGPLMDSIPAVAPVDTEQPENATHG